MGDDVQLDVCVPGELTCASYRWIVSTDVAGEADVVAGDLEEGFKINAELLSR